MTPEGDASGAELLMSPARRRVMDLLVAKSRAVRETTEQGRSPQDELLDEGMTAAELAEELGLHVTTVRFHLDQLVAAGLLTTESLRGLGAGRPCKVYLVNPGSLSDLQVLDERSARAFELLAGLLAHHWVGPDERAPNAEEAGRRWSEARLADVAASSPATTPGQWLHKLGTAVDALAEWGYTAEVSTSLGGRRASVRIVDCPFLALARDRPDVVCGVHRGLLDGAMSALGERTDVSLEPFITSRECLAHLTRQPFSPSPTERQR